jgi:predicted dehydrogenase
MLRLKVITNEPEKWQDAARRFRRAELVEVEAGVRPDDPSQADFAVLDGPVEAEPAAIERLLAAGLHVLVASSPCLPVDAIQRLAERARAAKLRLALVNPDRLLPSRQLIKSQLGGSLGSPELVRIHRRETHELSEATAPLGLPCGLASEIEQALWLVDRPLVRIFASESRIGGADAPGRCLLVHLAFEAGMAIVDYDDHLPAGTSAAAAVYRLLSVIGSSGSAQCDDHRNSQLLYHGGAPRGLTVDEGVRHLAALVDEFAAACEGAGGLSDGVDAWANVARVVAAVERSLKTRDAVNWENA